MSINENDNDNDNDNEDWSGEQGTGSVHGLTLSWTAACPLFSLESTDHQGGEVQDCEINILIE